ncbi:MAG: transposase [Anaerolineales bacterium]
MKYDPDKHHRRSIRLKGYDYSQGGAYAITVCIRNRECILGEVVGDRVALSALGTKAQELWLAIPGRFENVLLDEFIVMPNHVHGIIVIQGEVKTMVEPPEPALDAPISREQRRQMLIPKIVGYFKMNSAKAINLLRNTPGVPVWQRNYYERVIRTEEEWNILRQYIAGNPQRWHEDEENPSVFR